MMLYIPSLLATYVLLLACLAARTSETSVSYEIIWRHIPEDSTLWTNYSLQINYLYFPILLFPVFISCRYRVFRAQADWIFIIPSELPVEELRHLPRKNAAAGHHVLRSLIILSNEHGIYVYCCIRNYFR
jgi:hypothetical protein